MLHEATMLRVFNFDVTLCYMYAKTCTKYYYHVFVWVFICTYIGDGQPMCMHSRVLYLDCYTVSTLLHMYNVHVCERTLKGRFVLGEVGGVLFICLTCC